MEKYSDDVFSGWPAVSYPYTDHPLCWFPSVVIMEYIEQITRNLNLHVRDNAAALANAARFVKDIRDRTNRPTPNKSVGSGLMRRCFSALKYRFLFDCLYLAAFNDETAGRCICSDVKALTRADAEASEKLDKLTDAFYARMVEPDRFKLITHDVTDALLSAKAFEMSRGVHFVFTATMSAGKSTLINAIIGRELSHTKKAACTATVIDFLNTPVEHPRVNVVEGDNFAMRGMNLSEEDAASALRDRTAPCSVQVHFRSFLGKERVMLTDTPGVDSSFNPEHKRITRKALTARNADAVLYVVPVETYGSDDDHEHLMFIRDNVKTNKMFFIINMIDTCDTDDDDIDEILETFGSYLRKNGFDDFDLCPVSAKAGLLMKRFLNGEKLTGAENRELGRFVDMFSEPEMNMGRFYRCAEPEVDFGHWYGGKSELKSMLGDSLDKAYRAVSDAVERRFPNGMKQCKKWRDNAEKRASRTFLDVIGSPLLAAARISDMRSNYERVKAAYLCTGLPWLERTLADFAASERA